jgi:S-adenosylmethionine:tRNA ribosyltransferase-isomerase
MQLKEFNYNLPQNMIAQKPASPRDSSKLMLVNYQNDKLSNHIFNELPDFLKKGDVLVFNNTKVFPARLWGYKEETKGKIQIFLLTKHSNNTWQVLIGNRRKHIGLKIYFSSQFWGVLTKQIDNSVWEMKFNCSGRKLEKLIDLYGQVPIPPYIKKPDSEAKLKKEYQTVYAKNRGSIAAPTAGLHFTNRILNKLKKRGVVFKYVTLHVGLGTFEPVKEVRVEDHQIHSEFGILDQATAEYLNEAQKEGRRIIVVGTTTCRVLEAFSDKKGKLKAQQKWIDIFIYPGYRFKFVENLLTNFHLPKSTLLMLISALAGKSLVKKAYQKAIKDQYRFYSFGDAMLINNFIYQSIDRSNKKRLSR